MPSTLTKHRRAILDHVSGSKTPLSAGEVQRQVKGINLATVYRALEYLKRRRFLAGFTIDCEKEGIVRYYYPRSEQHTHFLHCESCHSFFPGMRCTLGPAIRKIERQNDFSVKSHILYFVGLCGACRKTKPA
jgi:Fur family ferric uptake transcriptional regulator